MTTVGFSVYGQARLAGDGGNDSLTGGVYAETLDGGSGNDHRLARRQR